MDAEAFTPRAGKQNRAITTLWFSQPRFQYGACGSRDGCTALSPTFPDHPHVSASAKDQVLTFETGHLGQAKAGLYRDQHKGVIASARPRALIRRG
jgi:hypothetical protein